MNICMRKVGMGQMPFQYNGLDRILGATWLECQSLKVIGKKTLERDGYNALILGFGSKKQNKINKSQHYLCEYLLDGFGPEKIYEYRLTADSKDVDRELGSDIMPHELFNVGSYVDVSGLTKGRGFAGVMKVWNFHGTRATHGVSKAHRKMGSASGKRSEGRVLPGKKMPKNYGNERVTTQSLRVVFADKVNFDGNETSLIALHGAVPGPQNSLCFLKRAVKRGGA